MLIGIDWGGTKIEGVALGPDGRELARVRADTPRHDYPGCLRVIGELVAALEQATGQRGSIGIGIPGSLEPRDPASPRAPARPGCWAGRSSTTCARHWAARSASRTMPTASPSPRPSTAPAPGINVVFAVILGSGVGRRHRRRRPRPPRPEQQRRRMGPQSAAASRHHRDPRAPPAIAAGTAAWRPGSRAAAFEADYAQAPRRRASCKPPRDRRPGSRAGDRLARLVWRPLRRSRRPRPRRSSSTPSIPTCSSWAAACPTSTSSTPTCRPGWRRTPSRPCFYTPIRKAVHGDSSGVRGAAWLWKD